MNYKILFALAVIMIMISVVSAGEYTWTSGGYTYKVYNGTVSYSFTPPTGVSLVNMTIVGPGGRGGAGRIMPFYTGSCAGAGGAGNPGASATYALLSVTPGSPYTIVVGTDGVASSAIGYTASQGATGSPDGGESGGGSCPQNGLNGVAGYVFDGDGGYASNGGASSSGGSAGGYGGFGYGAGGGSGGGSDVSYGGGSGGLGNNGLVVIWYPTPYTPTASFTITGTSGEAPYLSSFTDTSTGSPTSWMWNKTNVAGDNLPMTFSTSQNPSYTFTTPGNYSIQLTASTVYGSSTTAALSKWVNVSSSSVLEALFSANQTSGYPNDCFQFTDYSTGGPTAWSWDFGDLNTSVLQNPVHCYVAAGSYSVALNVSRTVY